MSIQTCEDLGVTSNMVEIEPMDRHGIYPENISIVITALMLLLMLLLTSTTGKLGEKAIQENWTCGMLRGRVGGGPVGEKGGPNQMIRRSIGACQYHPRAHEQ